MNLHLVSPCSQSFRAIGDLTEPSKRAFGERWGIPVHFPDYPEATTDHGWGRIDFMQRYLAECDWLLFMGADTMLVNHRIDARAFLRDDADLIAAWDANGLQSDVMFLRNCPQVHEVLTEVHKCRETDFHLSWLAGTEQGCLVRTLAGLPKYVNALPPDSLDKTGVRVKQGPATINRYFNDFKLNDWCFHACAMSMENRIMYLTAFSKQILT